MEFLVETGASAMAAFFIVAMFKRAFPVSPSWAVIASAVIAGQLAAFLLTVAQGEPLTAQAVAATVLTGIGAAATAAGVRGLDNSADVVRADEKREAAKE